MELWFQVIIEWVNCLGIIETKIKELKELEDGTFYKKLLDLISWKNNEEISNNEDIIAKFLEDEYPECNFENENDGSGTGQLYIASLFLLHTSQSPIFHKPMCLKLHHETQVKIKTFLEMVIPHGKDLTKDTIKEVLTELEDAAPKTPMTPRTRALKDFFNSPAARSASSQKIMTERNRELRKLKTELEVERFEKADMQEDLKIQQNKIQSLQKKLEAKTAEIKALREERMRPRTPQSCKKNKDTSDLEHYYKKEIDRLENQLMLKQFEVEKLEEDNENLSKKLAYTERQYVGVRGKLENCEKSLEGLQNEGEIKDRELVNLRMTNEELRSHLKEVNKTSTAEQSFEMDGVTPLHSPSFSLNTSEALSSVIDIQLQEAKEECASLTTQLNISNKKLASVTEEYEHVKKVNIKLKTKASMLKDTQKQLTVALDKLSGATESIENLEKEKVSLISENKSLEDLHKCLKEDLIQTEKSKNVLIADVNNLNNRIQSLETSLQTERADCKKLNMVISEVQTQLSEKVEYIRKLTVQNDHYKSNIEHSNTSLRDIILRAPHIEKITKDNLNDMITVKLIENLEIILSNFEEKCCLNETEIKSLQSRIEETCSKLTNAQSYISDLEKKNKQCRNEISDLQENIKKDTITINDLNDTINKYSEEIVKLKEVVVHKQALEKSLCKLKEDGSRKDEELKFSTKRISDLEQDISEITNKLHLNDKNHQLQFDECRKKNMEIVEKLSTDYKMMCENFQKEESSRKELEDKIANIEKEFAISQDSNQILENNLLEKKQTISNLKSKLMDVEKKLEQSAEDLERHENAKKSLEEEHERIIAEKDINLDRLKSENIKLTGELKSANDKLNLLQKQVDEMLDQINLKDEQIKSLLSEINGLKVEKEHLTRLQIDKETKASSFIAQLETKLLEKQRAWDQLNIEATLKEESLELVRNKLEKITKENISSELKMKEVIMNLQEVRANQDAILTVQEKGLKERSSHLEQVQKEFDESKKVFSKRLEDEKSLRNNLESTYSELQAESNKQMNTIQELQDLLKKERSELDMKKEYCKAEDMRKSELAKVCETLEHSINDLKSTIVDAVPDSKLAIAPHNPLCGELKNRTKDVLNIVQTAVNEVQASRKLILHLLNTNTSLNKSLQEHKETVQNHNEEIRSLKTKTLEMENMERKQKKHFNNLIKHKESLKSSLQNIMKSRDALDISLNTLKERWNKVTTTFHGILSITDKSVCDELKHIRVKKAELEAILSKHRVYHLQNMKPLNTILWQKFLWTEQKLESTFLNAERVFDISTDTAVNEFADDKAIIDTELEKNKVLQKNIAQSEIEVEDFSNMVALFEINFKSDETTIQSEEEKKLQMHINELTKEKNDMEDKLDLLQIRNKKLEAHVDELRNKLKEIKAESVPLAELDVVKKKVTELKEENLNLCKERDELRQRPRKEEVDAQLKQFHTKYEANLESIKQGMKTAYNEQIAKLTRDQDKCVRDNLESLQRKMEQQCRKQADEISKYKAHVTQLSSQYWNVSEKLLIEQQRKEELEKELCELKIKMENMRSNANQQQLMSAADQRIAKFEKKDLFSDDDFLQKVAVIEEKTTYERRCSIRSIQTLGNVFNVEDEEEVFDNTYLADMKEGSSINMGNDRLSILKKRNALCKPHLKSSYPAEMQFHPLTFTEEEIKTGSLSEDVFNDSLSQSLLPEQKTKKKDRTQTSYKKPGPPTPSKNGGRLSLQGNELRSPNSRVLRERNKERATATPRTIRMLFGSKRQDENVTPRGGRRRSSIFRKYRVTEKRGD